MDQPKQGALLAAHVRLAVHSFLMFAAFASLVPPAARAQSLDAEGAVGYFTEEERDTFVSSFSAGAKTPSGTSARVGVTHKSIDFKDKQALIVTDQLEGATSIKEDSFSLGVDQGILVGTDVGVFVGQTRSPLGNSRWLGARAGQWWLLETWQTTLDIRRTVSDLDSQDVTDTDGRRVVTPEKLEGTNVSLGLMNFATPSTILRGGVSRTTRNDRPDAFSVTAEIRQYVDPTRSALHLSLSHYENVGSLEPVTLYGTVVANSARLEWHQHVAERVILMGGYRYYVEEENPRAEDASHKRIGSDSLYGDVRWRFREEPWAADQSEVYSFFGRYSTSTLRDVKFVGLGLRHLW